MKYTKLVALAAAMGLGAPCAQAAILYNTGGYTPAGTYSQNFDSLPNAPENVNLQTQNPARKWVDDTAAPGGGDFSIPGFYLWHPVTQAAEGGTNQHQRVRIGPGTANTGAFMSFGSQTSTDRALGMLSSNTMAAGPTGTVPDNFESYYGARITNNTGYKLTQFTLSYTGEQWRDGGTPTTGSVAQTNTFAYKLTSGAAAIQDAGFTAVPALNFTSPSFGATTQDTSNTVATNQNDRDGNSAANRTVIGPVTVSGLEWLPGQDLWLRWTDLNDTGNDHGLAIDDLVFNAVPEPGSLGAIACGLLALFVRRRRA
jgi:hypothetical protein